MNTKHTPMWWEDAAPTYPLQSLPSHAVDVAVVGAGITGLTAALLLQQRGLNVVVVDMQGVGLGDTGRSTAHITQLLDTPYYTLVERFGEDGAQQVAQSQAAAIEQIEKLVLQEQITCQWGRVPAYLYSDDAETEAVVQREWQTCANLGLAVQQTHQVPVPFPTGVALRLDRQAQLNPLRYIQGLADRFVALAGILCSRVRVLGVADGQPCVVYTHAGDLKARHVIIATHSPVTRFNLHTKIYAYRTYVMAARVRGMPPSGLYFDAHAPYHYLRPHHMSGGEVLLAGGADHKTGHESDTAGHFKRLDDFLEQRFVVEQVAHRWSGQVLESADGLPFAGPNGSDERVWVATGYAGNGISSGTLAAMILADTLTDRLNPYADLYSSRRLKPLAQLRRMMRENIDVPLHIVGDRFSTEETSIAALPRGSGAVLRHDGQALAVYRDDTGRLHAMLPACTHMGCHVKWNGAEQSWDCPCHGSRYSATGELLQGPAVEDLARLDFIDTARDEAPEPLPSFLGEPKLTS